MEIRCPECGNDFMTLLLVSPSGEPATRDGEQLWECPRCLHVAKESEAGAPGARLAC